MVWHKVTVSTAQQQVDHVEAQFWETGALSVTLTDPMDQPIYEPGPGEIPLWESIEICGPYQQDQDITAIVANLEADGLVVSQVESMADRVWEREWLTDFVPMPFGDRLWIVPTEFDVPEQAKVALRLDPGLAFGTGTHETTSLILTWLDAQDCSGKTVLDFGAGSGVLGIAALLLGAVSCCAVDTDPQAVTATLENAMLNRVSDRISAMQPETFLPGTYDLVLANILAEPLVELAPQLTESLAAGGVIVLSGILSAQQEQVEAAYEGLVQFIDQSEQAGWVCLVGRKC